MAIDPKTGLETTATPTPNPSDSTGVSAIQSPAPIATPDTTKTAETTPSTAFSASVTPISTNIGGTASTPPVPATPTPPAGTYHEPVVPAGTVQNQLGITDLQSKGIQAIYQGKIAAGQTPQQAMEAIHNEPGYDAAKAAYYATPTATETTATTTPGQGQKPTGDIGTTPGEIPPNVKSIIDSLDPNGQMTPDQRRQIESALTSTDPTTGLTTAKYSADVAASTAKQVLSDMNLARDTARALSEKEAAYQASVADLKRNSELELNKQLDNMKSNDNNMGMLLGTEGAFHSQKASDAAAAILRQGHDIYNNMIATRDSTLAQLAAQFQSAKTTISENYTDQMTQTRQDMLNTFAALDKTGALNTANGLMQAQSALQKMLQGTIANTTNYANTLKVLNDSYTAQHQRELEAKTPNSEQTKLFGDGYIRNDLGNIIKDNSGHPMKIANTTGTLLTQTPITMSDGTKAFVYQNTDGSIRTEKIQGTTAAQITPEALQHIAQGVSSGAITPELLKSMNLTTEQMQAVISQTTGGGKAEWKVIGKDENGYDKYGWVNPNTQTVIEGGTTSTGNVDVTPGKSGTRADRNNNPGNLRIQGDQGIDSEGFGKFSTPEAGFQAMVSDITAKVNGQSKYSANIHTLKDLISIYAPAGDNNDPTSYSGSVSKSLGIKPDTPIEQLKGRETELAKAMAKHEGFTGEIKTNVTPEQTKGATSNYPQYIAFVENNGQLPAGIKDGTPKADQFKKQAEQGYIDAKNEQMGQSGFKISNPQAFTATSKKQKETIDTALSNVQPFLDSMDRLKELVTKYGTENPYSEAGKKISSEARNAQLIAKEIYNLGVLNGPDLSLMESIIPNPSDLAANTIGIFQDYPSLVENGKQKILDNMKARANSVGLEFIGQGTKSTTIQTSPPVTINKDSSDTDILNYLKKQG